MNVDKTQLMGRRNKCAELDQVKLCLEGTKIQRQDHVKYLGVWIDKSLSWKVHITELRRKCAYAVSKIRRIRSVVPQNLKAWLYKGLVLPHLDYCSIVCKSAHVSLELVLRVYRTMA